MTNNRPPPAFQEYASDILSDRKFRMLSLAERGLLMTMRLECWVNKLIPATPSELAILLNLNPANVQEALTNRVAGFFERHDGNFYCPELEDYREQLAARKEAQSAGGRKGGETTQKRHRLAKPTIEYELQAISQADLQGKVKPLRGGEVNRGEVKREELPMKGFNDPELDQWVSSYDASPSPSVNEYARQSKGS